MEAHDQTGRKGYLPYFYQAGLYLWSESPGEPILQKLYKEQPGGYDFTSAPQLPYWPQTVEQVIRRGYLAVKDAEPETALLSDKHRTSWLGLDDIISQIRSRYEIYDKHIYQIEQGKCYAISSLWRQIAYRGGITATSKEQYVLTKQLQELYQQERQERTNLWQDISKLKLLFPETAQQFLSAHRKVSILSNPNRDVH